MKNLQYAVHSFTGESSFSVGGGTPASGVTTGVSSVVLPEATGVSSVVLLEATGVSSFAIFEAAEMLQATMGSSFSNCEETVVSEAASSIVKFETSPPRELSSSLLTDGAGDGDESESSTDCWRLQYMMLAVRVRIIF